MGGPPEKYPQPGKPYGGFKPVPPAAWQSRVGYVMGVSMWLWIFYRGKKDLPHLLGWKHPWDHHGGHGGDGHEAAEKH
ncbi:unnamed protein product [Chondrus crispus]|uniref:NADH dehydrogenase [ubiquinone] 1 beta subcomplex subunit 2 n=1 Tax=Chondrus crispus TaxID=2769 RepID=R7Q5C9_CHOCR|nr:unnamed protein product [Chondrus crispus]CDF32665.1 unnamed protein product [Chondrus crispus]|eukprot:XP_005712436.1 unnamed protein product [Chondrus crispus]